MVDGDLELRIAWECHVGRTLSANECFASVVGRYREPHRHYHDVRHVRWVVRHVRELAGGHVFDDLGPAIAAAFFHDAIYDPASTGNETASATLASAVLHELGWSDALVAQVSTMIVGTIDHDWTATTSIDAHVLYAADLGVLAAEPAGYSAYVRNVRREYGHVSDDDWAVGRAAVLRSFLERAAIYSPRLDLTGWELRARGNLTAELDSLVG